METIRYSLIGKQDVKRGFGTFEVTLADGRVVTMDEMDIAYLVSDAYTEANLPSTSQGRGRLARVTDGAKGLWILGANDVWYSITGEIVNVFDYATLAAAVSDISTTTRTLLISDSVTVSANLTIPANVTLMFTNQGQLSVSGAVVLTCNALILAPKRRIFAGAGTVSFADGSPGPYYPEWFGAVVDGATDDTSVVNTTIQSISTTPGGVVIVSPNTLWTPSSVTIPSNILVEDYADPDNPRWRTSSATRNMMESILGVSQFINALSITASVGSNALTVALKTSAGSDATTSDPITIPFRSTTGATSTYTNRSVTSALSVVASAGSTLGFSASQTSRIYLVAIDNAGTVELALWHPLSGTSLQGLIESQLYSTTAEGGAGGADSAQVLYSTTARSNVAVRVLGFVEIQTGGTAGNWSNAASRIQVMGPGVPSTGDIIQVQYTQTGAVATGTTVIPDDDTIPQITEGDQYLSQVITPTNAVNRLFIQVFGHLTNTASLVLQGALFQDATANALASAYARSDVGGQIQPVAITHDMAAGTASATTLRARLGSASAGTSTFNGRAGGRLHGGVLSSWIRVTEIFT